MLGGSSGINYRQLVFASRTDLDVWGILGDTGWNYDTILPKFEKVQGTRPEQEAAGLNSFINEGAHGYGGGPINASSPPDYNSTPPSRPLGQERWPTWS